MNKRYFVWISVFAILFAVVSCCQYRFVLMLKSGYGNHELAVGIEFVDSCVSLLDSGSIMWTDAEGNHIRSLNMELNESTTNAIQYSTILLPRTKKKPACFVVTTGGRTTTNSFSRQSGVYYADWRGDDDFSNLSGVTE